MRRALLALAVLCASSALLAPGAAAHPLGNFTINHLSRVKVSSDGVEIRYILDQAEIPTFQERDLPAAERLDRKRAEVVDGLRLTVDGRDVPLRLEPGSTLSLLPGQGGLQTTRGEFLLRAPASNPGRVALEDATFADRQGFASIVPVPGEGTEVRTQTPSGDPTDGLRRYPASLVDSPPDRRSASLAVRPGDGTLIAPKAPGGEQTTSEGRSGDGFAEVFRRGAAGETTLAFLLLAALAWGAFHALSPGHGKAMVAAYLVGTRGTARHAVALGATVTVTHTVGVFALGVVTLLLSQYVLPEDLYPWLNLASGLLVVVIGAAVLRSRVRWARGAGARREDHSHDGHSHHSHEDHSHEDHSHEDHSHHHAHGTHGHHHHMPDRVTWRGLMAMGASAGLIPCPSALVVLLAAISQHEVALGLLLIVVFSLGLAGTLTLLGLAVVSARSLSPRLRVSRRVATLVPALSAVVIVGAGCLLTAQAIPQLV